MFHRLNEVSYGALEKLNEVARLTIEFGLRTTDTRNTRLIRKDFIAFLADKGHPNAGEWLWRKHGIIKRPLVALLGCSTTEKQPILESVLPDFDVRACFRTGAFSFHAIDTTSNAFGLVSQIMLAFYDPILTEVGFPADLCGESDALDRQRYLQHYLLVQSVKVCPGCDGSPPSKDQYEKKVREDVDHFFPKSKYPFLAVHPLNLVPLCKTCNQTYKAARDAITDAGENAPNLTSLQHIFHPYLRPAIDEVDVVIESTDGEAPELFLKPKGTDPLIPDRIKSLDYLLRLGSRWNGDLCENRIKEDFEYVIACGTSDERIEMTLDETMLLRKLAAVRDNSAERSGRVIGAVKVSAYAAWLCRDNAAWSRYLPSMLVALIPEHPNTTRALTPTYSLL